MGGAYISIAVYKQRWRERERERERGQFQHVQYRCREGYEKPDIVRSQDIVQDGRRYNSHDIANFHVSYTGIVRRSLTDLQCKSPRIEVKSSEFS